MKRSIAWLLVAVMMLSTLALLPWTVTAASADQQVLDFGTDGTAQVEVFDSLELQANGFTRWFFAGNGVEPALVLNDTRDWMDGVVKVVYRTEMQGATLKGGLDTLTAQPMTGDGRWNTALFRTGATGIPSDFMLRVDADVARFDYVDVAYVGFFATEEAAEAYTRTLSTYKYEAKEDAIPVYNVTEETVDAYFNAPDYLPYGQRFTADEAVVGIYVTDNSFYRATSSNNAGTVKVWAWNTDYATTTEADPLRTVELSKLSDKSALKAVFDNALPAGEYFFEVQMTAPTRGAYVAKASTGAHKAGVESYCGGEKSDKVLSAGYLVEGYSLTYLGNDYVTDAGAEFDFSWYTTGATEFYALTDATDVTVTELCDKGYLSLEGNGATSAITLPVQYAYTNETDHVVIWYRLAEGDRSSAKLTATTAGGTYEMSVSLMPDGQWHTVTVTDEDWSEALEKEITAVTLSGIDTLDIAYMGFYANADAAEACAAGMTGAPATPLSPEQAQPQLLLDGDRLTMAGGNQCNATEYDYATGSLKLMAKGDHPFYSVISEPTVVAPILAIRYRLPEAKQAVQGKYYIGSVRNTPSTGGNGGDFGTIDYVTDGRWHTAIIDLTELADYDAETNVINYFRFDFMNGVMVGNESTMEIGFYGFFNSEEEVRSFQHDVPRLYTVMFDTGLVKAYAQFKKTDTKEYVLSLAPTIYPVSGYIVTWEDFEVKGEDMELHLVYTPVQEGYDPEDEFANLGNNKPGTETETETGAVEETTDVIEETTTASDDVTGEETTGEEGTSGTNAGAQSGCKAVIASASALGVIALAAAAVICKKKD